MSGFPHLPGTTIPFKAPLTVLFADTFTGTTGDPWSPSLWPTTSATGTSFADINANRGRVVAQGGANVRIRKVASMANAENVDILYSWTRRSTGEFYSNVQARSNRSDYGAHTGYLLEISDTDLDLIRAVAGVQTNLGNAAKTWTVNQEYQLRFQLYDTILRARAWATGAPEPSTWDIDTTDPTIPTGGLQVMHFNGGSGSAKTADYGEITVSPLTL